MTTEKLFTRAQVKLLKGEGGYDFEVIASTDTIDRHGEVLDQNGWQTDNYKKNPVILWAHDYTQPPVGKATFVAVENGKLVIRGVFATRGVYPFADTIRGLYEDEMLNAVSVGFTVLDRKGNVIVSMDLLELSFVPVPANPEALALAATKGMDKFVRADYKEPEEKGAVGDLMNARQNMTEQDYTIRWAWCDVAYAITGATCELLFRPDTLGADIPALMREASDLFNILSQVGPDGDMGSNGKVTEGMKSDDVKAKIALLKAYSVAKEGRVLSDKNRKLIQECVSTMESSLAALASLLDETEAGKALQGSDSKAPAVKVGKPEGAVAYEVSGETLADIRRQLRANDRVNELVLNSLNRILRARGGAN